MLAAGGVLWRAEPELVVAVVHRPRYDDWSLPKGKLDKGEPALLGALREVREETGFSAVPGRTLGRSDYRVLQDARQVPKTVRWWAMRATAGSFVPGPEVDALRWLPPELAAELLTAGRDKEPLRLLQSGPRTSPVLLVRHASAGSRAAWPGADELRPLDDRGVQQAAGLVDVLAAYAPARVLSAPTLRCTATVGPLAKRIGLPVQVEDVWGEDAWEHEPGAVLRRLRELAELPGPSVVCSHRGPLPGIVRALALDSGRPPGRLGAVKASVWALTLAGGELVDADYWAP